MPTPSARPIVSIAPRATGSPSCASSVISGPVSSRPSSSALPERACPGRRATRQRRLAHERRAGGHRLQAAAVRAVALARRPVDVDHHVAHLGAAADRSRGRPRRASTQPAADPGAEREQHDVGRALRRARSRASASTAQFASLSTTTGSPSRSAITSRERDVLERQR